jgi:CRISPR/Cas system-associated exonuclease Cas4 (RecB family)
MPKVKGSLRKRVKRLEKLKKGKVDPLWKGPQEDGITQSMISHYLSCQERFRIRYMLGLMKEPTFEPVIEYGQMWHILEEDYSKNKKASFKSLMLYCSELCRKYPTQQFEIIKWMNVVKVQYPIYVEYWKEHSDEKKRKPILQEQVFSQEYELPSQRKVLIRGKIDAADEIGDEFWMQENKSKGTINEERIHKTLLFDLQTMTYLICLELMSERKVSGVRYNVIKRPLSGGKGSIRRHKAKKNKPEETWEEFYSRLGEVIQENEDEFFLRLKVHVDRKDVEQFKLQFLNPVLENILDDYEWWEWCCKNAGDPFNYLLRVKNFPTHRKRHIRMPYMFRPVMEGWDTDTDEYLSTGNLMGLHRSETLFGEL